MLAQHFGVVEDSIIHLYLYGIYLYEHSVQKPQNIVIVELDAGYEIPRTQKIGRRNNARGGGRFWLCSDIIPFVDSYFCPAYHTDQLDRGFKERIFFFLSAR